MTKQLLVLAGLLTAALQPLTAGTPVLDVKAVFSNPSDLSGGSRAPALLKRIFFGIKKEEGGFVRPMSMAEAGGFRYVCDPGAPAFWIISLSDRNTVQASPPGGWRGPMDVAVGGGRCYVSDPDAGAVWSYDLHTHAWTRIPGDFRRPTGLGWAASRKTLLIVDTEAQTLYAWDGKVLAPLVRDGLNFPTDAAELDADTLLVADSMNHQIDFWNWKGERVGGFGSAGDGWGAFAFIRSVAVDARGRIYVSDVQKDWIQVFDRAGRLLTVFGDPGDLHHPSYLSAVEGGLWVADAFAGRIVELIWK